MYGLRLDSACGDGVVVVGGGKGRKQIENVNRLTSYQRKTVTEVDDASIEAKGVWK